MSFPLDAYLARIAWTGAARPAADNATLDALVLAHTIAIPFENLDPLRSQPVEVDSDAVATKLINGRRGGYCFEHSRLFADALRAVGYTVRELVARVVWNQPEDAVTPPFHMLLDVDTPDGSRLVDVGFGVFTVTAALRWQPDVEQATPHGPYRLLRNGDEWRLQAFAGEWRPLYRLLRNEMQACDYVAPSYYLSTHPQSLFTQNLILARAGLDRRWTLFNRELSEYRNDGGIARRVLDSDDALIDVLDQVFGLAASTLPDLRARLHTLPLP